MALKGHIPWNKNKPKYIISKKFLIKEYSKREKSPSEIAKQIGCSSPTILERLKQYNIHIRSRSESLIKYNFVTKKFLLKEYVRKRKSPHQIGRELGCSYRPIRDRLIKFGIYIRNLSEAQKGNRYGYTNGNRSTKHYCIEPDCSNEICYENWRNGNGRCRPCAYKKLWGDKKFMEKIIKASFEGRKVSPNKPEKQLNKLLNEILPNEYKINVKGNVIIERLVPDFVNYNGQKKIIELFGDYWHNLPQDKKRDKRRLKSYAKYGYKTLIIWQHELRNLERVKEKILTFNKMQKGR